MNNKRIIYPDFLRIICAFAVVLIHVVSQYWYNSVPTDKGWVQIEVIDSLSQFAVPIFFMISGIFMLDPTRQKSIKSLYTKNLLRIFTAFVFWSFTYSILYTVCTICQSTEKLGVFEICKEFIINFAKGGSPHIWFMFALIGLYIATPILRKITENKNILEYFLIVWFVISLGFNFVELVFDMNVLEYIREKAAFSIAINYSGYYCLGYYLHTYGLSKKQTKLLYPLGALSLLLNNALTIYISLNSGYPDEKFLTALLPTTALYSAGVFVFFKNLCERKNFSFKKQTIIFRFSKYTFGIYLSHMIFVNLIFALLPELPLPLTVRIFIISVIVFIASAVTSAIINKIPVLKKYIL